MSLSSILEEHGGFILRFRAFADIKEALQAVYGDEADSILFSAAKRAGERSARRRLATAKTRAEALRLLSAYKRSQNWGDIHFDRIDWEQHTGRIVIFRSFEARETRSEEPVCHFLRGYLAGFISELVDGEIAITEDACLGKGDSSCVFTFSPRT